LGHSLLINTSDSFGFTDNESTTGGLFEILGGWAAQTRWQRAGGHSFPHDKPYSIEDVFAKWDKITDFNDGRATYPTMTQEAIEQVTFVPFVH
jgi:multifunctional beta-oxidation protein